MADVNSSDVLFTSPLQPIGGCSPDVYTWDKPSTSIRLLLSFLDHPGLAWLRENTSVETLDYPTLDQFRARLEKPPRVLGISFYLNETDIAIEMAQMARNAGVQEVWAGNFGGYTPEVESYFDKVITGWGEHAVAAALGTPLEPEASVRHPEIYSAFGSNLVPNAVMSGVLFTSRGCPYTCNFCQTPDFYGKSKPLDLEEIDRILGVYKARGASAINILDENFGTFKKHSREVARLLKKHDLKWVALTRVDTMMKNFDVWRDCGFFGAHLGIESLNDGSLEGAVKRIDRLKSIEALNMLRDHNMFAQIFYIVGFEQDTPQSVRDDIDNLATLDFDVCQMQVLTPYPRTDQRREIEEKYGIFDYNLSKYNSRNLVWNHPHITPNEMTALKDYANRKIVTNRRALRTVAKVFYYHGQSRPNSGGLRQLISLFGSRGRALRRDYADKLNSARQWSRRGWDSYEERPADGSTTAQITPSRALRIRVRAAARPQVDPGPECAS